MKIEFDETNLENVKSVLLKVSEYLGICYTKAREELIKKVVKLPTLGERLKALREYMCLSKNAVCRCTYISVDAIRNYETNKSVPGVRRLISFSKLYRVSVDTLLGIDRSKNNGQNN